MFNIILMGMPGSGKSAVGRILADRMSTRFIDTDALIEQTAGATIDQIWNDYGEREFRSLEKEIIEGLSDTTNAVIATGGGSILDPDNFSFLSSLGKTIALLATPKTLYQRLKKDRSRPLFESAPSLLDEIENVLQKRIEHYKKADYLINTDRLNPDEVVDEIIQAIKS